MARDNPSKEINEPDTGRYSIGIVIEAAGNCATIVCVGLDGVAKGATQRLLRSRKSENATYPRPVAEAQLTADDAIA